MGLFASKKNGNQPSKKNGSQSSLDVVSERDRQMEEAAASVLRELGATAEDILMVTAEAHFRQSEADQALDRLLKSRPRDMTETQALRSLTTSNMVLLKSVAPYIHPSMRPVVEAAIKAAYGEDD